MNGPDRAGDSGRSVLPGLFTWQILLLAWVSGLFGVAHPEALAAVPLLWLLCRALRSRPVPLAALALCCAAGFGWALLRAPSPLSEAPAWLVEGRETTITGVVDAVQSRPNRRLLVLLQGVSSPEPGAGAVPGLVAWTWESPQARPLPGQEVTLRTRVWSVQGLDNPGTWDGAEYWERQGVAFRAYTRGPDPGVILGPAPEPGFSGFRQLLRRQVEGLVPHTQGGAVVLAVLTGDRFLLTPATLELMRDAGLSHSLALSGLHLGFVAAAGAGLAYLLSLLWPGICLVVPRPKLAVLVAAPLVLAYAWLGQPAPSLVRAACMFLSWGLLLLWDRQNVLLDGLFLALAVILVAAPDEVQELSLQLSAVAVAGIAVFWAPLWRWAPRPGGLIRRGLRWAYGLLLLSVCANLALLPLMVWHFGVLAPNFLANLFWLPVLGLLVMPLGLAGLALLAFWPGAAALLLGWAASLAEVSLDVLVWADAHGWLPLVQTLRPLWPELLGGGVLLACLPLLLRRRAVPAPVLGLGLLLLIAPHVWIMARDTVSGPSLTLLDVGQGQAALLTLPGGGRVLVDGGGSRSATFDPGRSVVVPALTWGRPPRLEAVLLSSNDLEHSRGLAAVLGGFRVGFFASAVEPPEILRQVLARRGLPEFRLAAGQDLDLGQGFILEVIAPGQDAGKPRGTALGLRLAWNGRGLALLPGNQDALGLRRLLDAGRDLRAGVLVLPDHGSGSACAPEFYEVVSPGLALASCARGRDLPAASVAQALAQRGIPLQSTALCGRLRVFWDQNEDVIRAGSGRTCPVLETDVLP